MRVGMWISTFTNQERGEKPRGKKGMFHVLVWYRQGQEEKKVQ